MIMGAKFDELVTLKLNEMGDLLAGVFGPVAFLWLILGYLQQGRELRISSEALIVQASELKNSVDQQKQLVGISTDQLQMAKENSVMESRRLASSVEPKFVLSGRFHSQSNARFVFEFTLNNGGHSVTNLEVRHKDVLLSHVPILGSAKGCSFQVPFDGRDAICGGELRVFYLNGLEDSREKIFRFGIIEGGQQHSWSVIINHRQGAFV